MAKRQMRFITVPLSVWESADLTIAEKHLLIDIDSICDSTYGIAVGTQALATLSGMTQKEVKNTLNELYLKGAIETSIGPDGEKLIQPLLYKERYIKHGEKVLFGDKPTDTDPIDYVAIQESWNTVCVDLPKLDRFTARRKQKTRTCLKGADASFDDMIKVIKLVAASSFLNGKRTDWQCTYDWIIKSPDNFTKIFEGQYHKDYAEKQAYDAIMRGGEVTRPEPEDDYYR